MLDERTVFVVGAGASKEVGLPIGEELKNEITQILNIETSNGSLTSGDSLMYEAMHQCGRSYEGLSFAGLASASKRIRAAMPLAPSIDNYIDAHNADQTVERCGKLAIVRSILAAERRSTLMLQPGADFIEFSRLNDVWLVSLMKLLVENCRIDDLAARLSKITFIVFNYDRCIEHFLYRAIQTYYSVDANAASEIIKNLEIFHPYGSIGVLPIHNGRQVVDYGAEVNSSQLVDLSNQIRTFTEGTDEGNSEIIAIRSRIRQSTKLVFLGFAYHPLNMELLMHEGHQRTDSVRPKDVYGTVFQMSSSDRDKIDEEIKNVLQPRTTELVNLKSNKLIQSYGRALKFTG
jgi:hypothetical protein